MFGRVRRAAREVVSDPSGVAGVVHSYDPMVVGGGLAATLGAAAVGSGAAVARDSRGRTVSATVYAWTLMGRGAHLATWPARSFRTERTDSMNEHQARLTLSDGRLVQLSSKTGPHHRGGRRALDALARLAQSSGSGSSGSSGSSR